MARTEIPTEKIEAYRKTDYRFGAGRDAVTLHIDRRSDALALLYSSSGNACAIFITACNPLGQPQSVEANEDAHRRLGEALRALTPQVIEGAGADPSGSWPEEKSFFALGIELRTARDLGSHYRQDAIVWAGEDAVPQLILLR